MSPTSSESAADPSSFINNHIKSKKTFNRDLLIKLGWQPGILQPGLLLRRKFPNLGKFESKTYERGYLGGSDQSDEIKRNKKTHKIIKK